MSLPENKHKTGRELAALAFFDLVVAALVSDGAELVETSLDPSIAELFPLLESVGVNISTLGGVRRLPRDTLHAQFHHSIFCFMRSLTECLIDADGIFFQFPLTDYAPLMAFLYESGDEEQLVKRMKFLTAWPMARWQRNPVPASPKGVSEQFRFPLAGRARRHFQNLLVSRTSSVRSAQVFVALLQGVKRGCAQVNDIFIESTLLKHREALTTPVDPLPPKCAEVLKAKFDLLWRRKTGHRHFGNWRTKSDRFGGAHIQRKEYESTTHAAKGWSRGRGGRLGAIRQLSHLHASGTCSPSTFVDLLRMDFIPWENRTVSAYGIPQIGYNDLLAYAEKEIDDAGGLCHASVKPILEPLKCRLITAGNPIAYAVAKCAQKSMWRHLHESFDQFRLIGRPLESDDLFWIHDKTSDQNLAFDKWVSGDYSAATDGLGSEINRMAMSSFCDSIRASEQERKVFMAVLGNHRISYDQAEKAYFDKPENSEPFLMQNGQLMGSPLSFPVLCAINLVAYWAALEEYTGRSIDVADLPVLVNGDDILFRSNDEFYPIWQNWIRAVGFNLSVGKNYISRDFLTVNSESFVWNDRSKKLRKVGFLNPGLLIPSACVRPENRMKPVTENLQSILDEAVNPERAFRRFVHYNLESIKALTRNGNVNVFAANELGGLGVKAPPGINPRFTPYQKQLAAFLAQLHFAEWAGNEEKLVGQISTDRELSSARLNGVCVSIKKANYRRDVPILNSNRTYRFSLVRKSEKTEKNELPELEGPPGLLHYQVWRNSPFAGTREEEGWTVKHLGQKLLNQFRSKKRTTLVRNPSTWDYILGLHVPEVSA